MDYNTIDHAAEGTISSFNTYAKQLSLPKKLCVPVRAFNNSTSQFWNCRLCGNDKKYEQPVLADDYLYFQFRNYNIFAEEGSPLNAGWKGVTNPYIIGATLVTCNDLEIPLETFDPIWQGGWIGLTPEGDYLETFYIGAPYILTILKNAGVDDCCFYIRFDIYDFEGESVQQYFSEQYFLKGCYSVRFIPDDFELNRCTIPFTTGIFFNFPFNTSILSVTVTLATGDGPLVVNRTINYSFFQAANSSSQALITLQNFCAFMNIVFGDLGVWYYDTSSGNPIMGFYSANTLTAFQINSSTYTPTCLPVVPTTPPLNPRFCRLTLDTDPPVHFPFSGDLYVYDTNGLIFSLGVINQNIGDIVNLLNMNIPSHKFWEEVSHAGHHWIWGAANDSTNILKTIKFGTEHGIILPWSCQPYAPTEEDLVCFDVCKDTLFIQGDYSIKDCDSNYYKTPSQLIGVGNNPFQLTQRLYAKLTYVGEAIEKTETVNGVITSIKKRKQYELKGPLIPPYVAERLANILAAEHIFIDGQEYLLDQNSIQKDINYSNMWRLLVKFKSKNCTLIYGCE